MRYKILIFAKNDVHKTEATEAQIITFLQSPNIKAIVSCDDSSIASISDDGSLSWFDYYFTDAEILLKGPDRLI